MTADINLDPVGLMAPANQNYGRRALLKTTIGAIAFSAGAGMLSEKASAQTITDSDRLNLLLNLEYLLAEFYSRAAFGQGLSANRVTGLGTLGGVTGGQKVGFKDPIVSAYAREIAQDHIAHVDFLRNTLGNGAVAEPAIEFTAAFTNLAIGAGLIVPGQRFNPFDDDVSFQLGAFYLNDTVVAAYQGMLLQLTQSSPYFTSLAGMMVVQGYHAGVIRTELYAEGGVESANRLAAIRATLAGDHSDQPLSYNKQSAIALVDATGVAYARNAATVLSILYGAQGASNGLFFPSGVNGVIRVGA